MLRQILNQVDLTLSISPKEGILIKEGADRLTPALKEKVLKRMGRSGAKSDAPMVFVRDGNGKPYLPGSSLRGVIRSHAERICRSLKDGPDGACDPFVKQPAVNPDCSCSEKWVERRKIAERERQGEIPGSTIYRQSCPICKVFGNLALQSRCRLGDAKPNGDTHSEGRDGIAIDRFSGAVAEGPFLYEVITGGTFEGKLSLVNFELWQLELLLYVLRDMNEGLVTIGFGKARGLGAVTVKVDGMTWTEFKTPNATAAAQGNMRGIGSLLEKKIADLYKVVQPDEKESTFTFSEDLLRRRALIPAFELSPQGLPSPVQSLSGRFLEFLNEWQMPEEMTKEWFAGRAAAQQAGRTQDQEVVEGHAVDSQPAQS